jgi:hypothetical protein
MQHFQELPELPQGLQLSEWWFANVAVKQGIMLLSITGQMTDSDVQREGSKASTQDKRVLGRQQRQYIAGSSSPGRAG